MTHEPWGTELGSLPFLAGRITRQVSAENPDGSKGGACHADPDPTDPDLIHSGPALDLGRGWKVRPFVRLAAGATLTLADLAGPGWIRHVFLTTSAERYRDLVLRMYWDGETEPSVEVPAGDFFANGHDGFPHTVTSVPVTVAPRRGCNSYWQMPFRRHARLTLENQGAEDVGVVAWRVLFTEEAVPADAAYFHAQWRRTTPPLSRPEHVILDGVRGQGVYVGTYLAWIAHTAGWWGEGEVKLYLDGDVAYPTFADNGTEDYFGGAWGFGDERGREIAFSSPYLGMPLADLPPDGGPRRFSLYRWHLLDAIGFRWDLRVTVQSLGWFDGEGVERRYRPRQDDIAGVGYWYQAEPHAPFPPLPPAGYRSPPPSARR